MNRPWCQILLLFALVSGLFPLCRSAHAAPGRTVDVSVEPSVTDNFYEARSRLWVATNGSEPRGVLVLLSGTDSDARGKASDPFWQALAQREQLALLGVYFRGEGEPYESAAGGSGAALLQMIEQAATTTGLPHLSHAPLLLVGHSSGAMFVYNFAGWAPLRTAAFVALKTGPIAANPDPQFAAVPGLFIVGERDMDGRVRAAAMAFASIHYPAAWALAVEPSASHEWTTADNRLIDVYLHGLLSQSKLIRESALTGGCLKKLSNSCATNLNLPSSVSTVWLPDTASASAWERFTKPFCVAELLTRETAAEVPSLTIEPRTLLLEENSTALSASNEVNGSILVRIDHANSSGCTFNSSDPRLTITTVPQGTNHYRLDMRLRTIGLAGGLYQSTVNVTALNQQNARCVLFVHLLARVKCAVQLTPASLYVGVLNRSETCEKIVTIAPTAIGTPWKIRSVQSSNPRFATATLGTTQSGDTTLVCRFDAKEVLGNQSGCFEVALVKDNLSVRIKLPFIAFVSKGTKRSQGDATLNKLP